MVGVTGVVNDCDDADLLVLSAGINMQAIMVSPRLQHRINLSE
jgi:hypothetical protein